MDEHDTYFSKLRIPARLFLLRLPVSGAASQSGRLLSLIHIYHGRLHADRGAVLPAGHGSLRFRIGFSALHLHVVLRAGPHGVVSAKFPAKVIEKRI